MVLQIIILIVEFAILGMGIYTNKLVNQLIEKERMEMIEYRIEELKEELNEE